MPTQVAVVGAGMAGAACARHLADRGLSVSLFDKGRSVGGRLAQRRVGDAVFDHGAQYIGVRDPGFAAVARTWCAGGLAAGRDLAPCYRPWLVIVFGRGRSALHAGAARRGRARRLLSRLHG